MKPVPICSHVGTAWIARIMGRYRNGETKFYIQAEGTGQLPKTQVQWEDSAGQDAVSLSRKTGRWQQRKHVNTGIYEAPLTRAKKNGHWLKALKLQLNVW